MSSYVIDEAEATAGLEQYLEKQNPVIDLISKASEIEFCDWQYDRYGDIWNGNNDYAYKLTHCCMLVLASARYGEDSLSPSDIVKACKICLNTAEHINRPNAWDQLNYMGLRSQCFKYIHNYLNRHPNLKSKELSMFYQLLLKDSQRKTISLNTILDEEMNFTRIALTEHTDQKPDFESSEIKIIEFQKNGWKEFFESSLNYCENHIRNLRSAANTPIAIRSLAINTAEQKLMSDCDAFLEKFLHVPDDFVPTQKDYDTFIKNSGSMFAVNNNFSLFYVQQYFENSIGTMRNALLVGTQIILEYRKTNTLPKVIAQDWPKDAFGNQTFDLIKTEMGFILKSKSMDVRKKEFPKYEFRLPKLKG